MMNHVIAAAEPAAASRSRRFRLASLLSLLAVAGPGFGDEGLKPAKHVPLYAQPHRAGVLSAAEKPPI